MKTNGTVRAGGISRLARWTDRAMTRFIQVGGIGVIAAVFGIFVFILAQIVPLFRGARVAAAGVRGVPPLDAVALGTDEWAERPFLLDRAGRFHFLDWGEDGAVETIVPLTTNEPAATAWTYAPEAGLAAAGLADGRVAFVRAGWRVEFDGDRRVLEPDVKVEKLVAVGRPGIPVRTVRVAAGDNARIAAVVQEAAGRSEVHVAAFTRRRSLLGGEKLVAQGTHDVTDRLEGEPTDLLVNAKADRLVVVTDARRAVVLHRGDDGFERRQVFEPFPEAPDDRIATADYLLGDESVVFMSAAGRNEIWSLHVSETGGDRLFSRTKAFEALPGPATCFAASLRNKGFLAAGDGFASLRYATSETIRWQDRLNGDVRLAALGGKADRMLLLDKADRLHLYTVEDPHPEAGFRAFFGRIWYEGAAGPKFEWQSTGGSDDFEPKLSMVPLLIGTLKGTFYALVFSVPLALLAALYTSQFAAPGLKRTIKPVMEIMASLPSVILGFLAALWLAPLLETRVPSLLAIAGLVPLAAAGFGLAWSRLPFAARRRIPEGAEIAVALPLVLAAAWAGWGLGPWLERTIFVAADPATGAPVADFRLWWPQVTGLPFEQRNSLVVGFMMGFAVIPIIFTIAEDALSNVPASFRSSSLALGASRWQTAVRVILPTASAGIFSAVMIGLGRAVGETMIVLMATGNTPIMDFNIFSGMRTLSANIAVELPEAPHHGTLYRTLFLGSLLLFGVTFVVNTLAEALRHRLREKYKAV